MLRLTFGDQCLPERFWSKVVPEPNSGCWLWLGATTRNGYGHIWWPSGTNRKRTIGAHRLIAMVAHDASDKHATDHRCENTLCCNPDHLQVLTRKQHVAVTLQRRGPTTHCPNGHPTIAGDVQCLECVRTRRAMTHRRRILAKRCTYCGKRRAVRGRRLCRRCRESNLMAKARWRSRNP